MADEAAETIRIFSVAGCAPCEDLEAALEAGNVNVLGVDRESTEVEVIDLTTEEGYPYLDQYPINEIPSAYHGGQPCQILLNNATKTFTIDCRTDVEREELSRPPGVPGVVSPQGNPEP